MAVHLPSVPQPVAGCVAQAPLGSAFPAMTLAQVPSRPPVSALEHAWHWAPHAVLQQRPLTQKPLWHWLVAVHAEPWVSLVTHVPPLQSSRC